MSLPRYPEYKDSGVPWLGSVPTTWGIYRLKDVATVINGYPFDSKLFEANGSYPVVRIRDLDAEVSATRYNGEFVQAAAVTSSDVLIGMDGDFNVGRWRGSEVALLNQRMCCVRAEPDELSQFLFHMLPIPLTAINDITYWTTVKHLSSLDVEKIRFALPRQGAELFAIAAFLDRETRKIDALIAEQEKLITLLSEKHQATVSHAVARGLKPDAPMRDSGVGWLGAVPEHWDVCLLKTRFASVDYGTSKSLSAVGPLAVLRMGNIANGRVRLDDLKYVDEVESYLLLEPGDLLFNRTNSLALVGKVGLFEGAEFAISFASYLVRIRLNVGNSAKYFAYLLNAPGLLGDVRSRAFEAIGQCNLNPTRYGQIAVAVPPEDEQLAIAAFLESETGKIDVLKSEAERAIALFKERRSALIAAAVTGQIDVRGEVPEQGAPMEGLAA